jgi:hypothetical protein
VFKPSCYKKLKLEVYKNKTVMVSSG